MKDDSSTFLLETPWNLAGLQTALDAADVRALARNLHALKAGSERVDASDMVALCAELETLLAHGLLGGANDLCRRLEQTFAGMRLRHLPEGEASWTSGSTSGPTKASSHRTALRWAFAW